MSMETNRTPASIGIIMDGNRRWARARSLPTSEGHRKGYEKLKDVVAWAKAEGVGTLVVYAFSTENWKRSEEEVGYLMKLLFLAVREIEKEAKEKEIRVRFIGETSKIAPEMADAMRSLERSTATFSSFTLVVALSYGGRAEIVDAVKRIPDEERSSLTEERFARYLWTSGIPDPDLIIRTGGEERLSNFLPWQSVYSELFFVETLWPDFSREDLRSIIEAYGARERRVGK